MSPDLTDLRADDASSLAGLFPGQGSHAPAMRDLVEQQAPDLLARCIELVGVDPFPRVRESTRFAQPAIYCASIAGWLRYVSFAAGDVDAANGAADANAAVDGAADAAENDVAAADADGAAAPAMPIAYAGHSLGEIAALVAAGVIDQLAGLELATLRGDLMARASEGGCDRGMLALVNATEEQCAALADAHKVVVANDNSPGQVVLAGALDDLSRAADAAKREGLRTMQLDVADAFHSPAMVSAVEPFRAALRDVSIAPAKALVISCASAKPFEDVREELAEAIVRPVRWRATMQALVAAGAERFVDFGPGRVLARLATRNVPGAEVLEPAPRKAGPGIGAVASAA